MDQFVARPLNNVLTMARRPLAAATRRVRMARLAFTILLILLVGVWVTPFIGAARSELSSPDDTRTAPTTTPSAQLASDPTTAPAGPAAEIPAPPPLVHVRGTEGFWRIARDATGAWWFVSPEGRREFLNTVTTVHPYQLGRHADGPHYLSRDWTGGLSAESGDVNAWASTTLGRVRDAGFKGLGAWSHPVFHQHDVPMTRDLNIWSWATRACQRMYHPDWAEIAEMAVKHQVPPLRDNRNLVGYYTDNEIDWIAHHSPQVYFDHLPPDDPNRQMVVKVIRELWPSIEDFNAAWQVSFASYDDLQAQATLPTSPGEPYGQLMSAWLYRLASDYFKLTTELVRKYDPNHLVLGVRFKGFAPREVVRASRDFTDAQSLNYYVPDGLLDEEHFRMIHEESGQPLIITEYAFHSLDGRSGNRNTFGFAAQVLDQQARADGYRLMTTRLARVPWVIGADWFQWNDEPPSGRIIDGEDVNFGIVDVDDRLYDGLARAIRETTPLLNDLHASSATDRQLDVWRESFARKPTFTVPYLSRPIVLNGELSDWPTQNQLSGVRHGQTIGLERSSLPLPNVYVAWNESGLFLGIEVFDTDIQGAPANGWWWTRDNVEFWVSTRPVTPEQSFYTPYCHQFFFVPIEFPGPDGRAGTVGQWHRQGDALDDHRIPLPGAKLAVRILPNKYVAEMHVPAAAMHGFDPATQAELAFNLHVRNFQNATDYFWSAPKEVQTQLRPNTWGTLVLERPATTMTEAR
jgi:hypothetical protein